MTRSKFKVNRGCQDTGTRLRNEKVWSEKGRYTTPRTESNDLE